MFTPEPQSLSRFTYVVLDENPDYLLDRAAMTSFNSDFKFVGHAAEYDTAVDLVLSEKPDLIFLEIDSVNSGGLSLHLINELHRYMAVVPQVVITTRDKGLAYDALKFGVFDFLIKPLSTPDLRKCLLRFAMTSIYATNSVLSSTVSESSEITQSTLLSDDSENIADDSNEEEIANKTNQPLTICVKSYGDYRFISADDICYLQADNNSTDLHLRNGEMVTAFKTLKHFENLLNSPFVRIHNSYIVNADFISRIHTGNSVCYLKNSTTKLPFSKSYKENIDIILQTMAKGNYIEI